MGTWTPLVAETRGGSDRWMTDEEYLELVNQRVDDLESAVAEAIRKFERNEDPRAILLELFVDAGFLEGNTLLSRRTRRP